MKIFKKKLLIFCFVLLANSNAFTQNWINNDITEIIKKENVLDFCFDNNSLWILTERIENNFLKTIIIKYENDRSTLYFIDHIFNGDLSHFLKKTKNKNDFQPFSIKCTNNKIWIISRKNECAIIQNNLINFFNFYDSTSDKIKETFYSCDSNFLYKINNYLLDDEIRITKRKQKIFYSDGSYDFREGRMPIDYDSESYISNLYINNNNKIFQVANLSKYNSYLYLCGKNDSLIKIIGPFNDVNCSYCMFNKCNYFIFKDHSAKVNELVILDTNYYVVSRFVIPKIDKNNLEGCIHFAVDDDKIYISDDVGFYQWNYINNSISKINEKNEKWNLGGTSFHKLIIKDDIIFGCYGTTPDLMGCEKCGLPGIYLYKILK